ncbi:hypothetical protein [Sphingobacterium sp. DR205]|uniref:hypothetical protein n=1 Tax=Sphingobacterium sp. DR205 TaxID=2713573 RepID=UPI0013E43055|nr:hypothetical protein [Sphingobacterium sp. DR205]QIH31452.1 hypothetical protein G6053_00360 [Sphingobacterium sp. DR205]
MRKIMTLMLVILGITVSAGVIAKALENKKEPLQKKAITAWELTSPSANPTLETSYQPFTGNPEELCSGTEDVCAVMAEDRGDGHPQLTSSLINQINKQAPAEDVYFKN